MPAAQTTLAEALDAVETGVDVHDMLGFPAAFPFKVECGSERMLATAGVGSTWTVTRGYDGTTAAIHADGAAVTCVEEAYTSLALVKEGQDIDDTDDDVLIQRAVDEANERILERIGMFVGPSSDTSRTYDFSGKNPRRLWIRGGIRSVTALSVGQYTAAAQEAATIGDVLLRPLASERVSSSFPGTELWLSDHATGPVYAFYPGFGVITVTGAFGFAAVPSSLSGVATTLARRLHLSRQNPSSDIETTAWGTNAIARFLSRDEQNVIDGWAHRMSAFGYI